jgi:hypothetical protein
VMEKRFESVVEMRDAYIEIGGSCSDWEQSNQIKLALESGGCSDGNVMSIYSSRSVADEQNRAYKEFISDLMPSWIEEDRPISLLVVAMRAHRRRHGYPNASSRLTPVRSASLRSAPSK